MSPMMTISSAIIISAPRHLRNFFNIMVELFELFHRCKH